MSRLKILYIKNVEIKPHLYRILPVDHKDMEGIKDLEVMVS